MQWNSIIWRYTFEAVEGMPNHCIERENQQGKEYVTLGRVYADDMLFSNLTSKEQSSMFVVNKVFKTYVIASAKSKIGLEEGMLQEYKLR